MSFCLKARGKYYGNGEKLDCHMILYKIFCGLCLLCAADQAAKLVNMGESA
ncbi:MAG: hypothetical protein HFH39_06730 [Lachnospiraceae bacterium]|nr:hypothetical protein [Lachnospiraceae bacterium]